MTPFDFEVTGSKVKVIGKKLFFSIAKECPVRNVLILTFSHLKHVEYIRLSNLRFGSLSSKWPLLILTKWYAGVFTP
jgi:hypothetical protein